MPRDAPAAADGLKTTLPAYPASPAVTRAGDLWLLGQASLAVRRCTRRGLAYDVLLEGRQGRVRLHGSALQCADRRPRLRARSHPPSRICDGMRRDERGRVHALPARRLRAAASTTPSTARSIRSAWIGAICGRCSLPDATVYSELKNLCVWNKTNAGMGSFYRSKHELVFVWKNGTAPHINNFELGQHGRYRTNVWDYAGVNTMRAGSARRAGDASDREAGGIGRGCDQGLLQARRSGARPVCRQRKHDHCGRAHRS